ncbi:MAG: acyl-CoA dehydrogenase family protein, partial [Actinomycetota bacterium]|nr:acyl-CoA dehydrogenase family protein [Actinomycetota bacterium]
MDFGLTEEERAIRDTVREFVKREVMPLEAECLRRERAGEVGV